MKPTLNAILFSLTLIFVCAPLIAAVPIDQRESLRQELNQSADEIIAAMIEKNPDLEGEIDRSAGYLTGTISAGTLVVVGAGTGVGVIYDKFSQSRTYLNFKRLDIGAGLGAGRYRYLVIFESREALLELRNGSWTTTLGTESVAGERGSASARGVGRGNSTYVLSESGASVAITVRLVKTSINRDLTDTGVSDVSIPMSGYKDAGEQGDDAPRIWDHKLPFLAQKVLDEGYDLPLPYGVGLTYAYIDQDQLIGSLQVGINGGEIVPFEFVAFENAKSISDSVQLKYDTWVFPFMNIYAMIGRTEGDAPLDVLLDGNGMLDYLETDCSGLVKPPLCRLLEDKTITLPIKATFEGNTYSIGTILAGGWSSYFVVIPVNWTYVDMDTTHADGRVITVTPRVGKLFSLGDHGNLSVFVGGNYLDSDLTITGRLELPDDKLTLDYIIDQENADKWNAVIGANWDINRQWSVSAEYNGFYGSREAYIASVTWRF